MDTRDMEIDEIREHCLSKPGVTEGMKWGEHLTFMVGGKMFAIFGLDQVPINASFKVSDEYFEYLQTQPGMKAAPYLARHKWIAIDDIGLISTENWRTFLDESYKLIKAKLPRKEQQLLS